MIPAVVFGDVEGLLCTALPPLLAARGMTYPVGTRVPNPRPAAFWRVLASGGKRHNYVEDNPTVTVESWAATETQASSMARTIRAVIEGLAGQTVNGTLICRARDFSSPANLPDPASAQIRYTSTGSIYIRGAALT